FTIGFDFVEHALCIESSDGQKRQFPLISESVSTFHNKCVNALKDLGFEMHIYEMPNELPNTIALDQDTVHCSYSREYAHRFWWILLQTDRVLKDFRAR